MAAAAEDQNGDFGDMYKMGVIDPAKVIGTAPQDAASVAGHLVTTETMTSEKPKKEAAAPQYRAAVWIANLSLSSVLAYRWGPAGRIVSAFDNPV